MKEGSKNSTGVEITVSCPDCPFKESDRDARKLSEEELAEKYKKLHEAGMFDQRLEDDGGTKWLVIEHPCDTLKAVSFKCQQKLNLLSLIKFLRHYYVGKKRGELSTADLEVLIENALHVDEFKETYLVKKKNRQK